MRTLTNSAASTNKMNRYAGWWYTAERGPVFNRIRSDPRFRALAAQVKKHRQQQRALLEEMRRKGEVPKRSQPGTQVLGVAAFDIAGFCHLLHVVSEGYPRGHRSRYGGLAWIPGVDLSRGLAVVRGIAADVTVVVRPADIFRGQARGTLSVWMGVPLAQHLGP